MTTATNTFLNLTGASPSPGVPILPPRATSPSATVST